MADNQEPEFTIGEEEFQAAVSPPDVRGRINLRIEALLEQEIRDIAEDGRYPLYSVSEVVRFCCMIGVPRLRAWKPQPTLIGALRAANALAVRDKIQCEALDMLTRLDERMNWYIRNNYFDEAIDLVAKMRGYFDNLQSDFWSDYIVKQIDEKFDVWLEAIQAAKGTK